MGGLNVRKRAHTGNPVRLAVVIQASWLFCSGASAADCNQNEIPDDRDLTEPQRVIRKAAELKVGGSLTSLTALDLDQDGDQDFLVSGQSETKLSRVLNVGNGALGTAAIVPLDEPAPALQIVADLNGDGTPEVIGLSGSTMELVVLTSDGNGAIAISQRASTMAYHPFAVSTLDADGDLKLDVAVAAATAALTFSLRMSTSHS